MTTHRSLADAGRALGSSPWGWILFHHIGGRGAVMLFFVLLPILMPIAEAGRFGFWFAAWTILLQPWFDSAPGQQIAKALARGEEQVGLGIYRRTRRQLIAVGLAAATGILVAQRVTPLLLPSIVLLALVGSSLQSITFAVGRGREQFALEGQVGGTCKLFLPVIGVLLARQLPDARAAACALAVTSVTGATWALLRARAWSPADPGPPTRSPQAASQRREMFQLAVLALVAVAYLRLDLILLGWLRDDTQVGAYMTVSRWVEASFVVPQILLWRFFPRIAQFDDPTAARTQLRRGVATLALLGSAAAGALAALGVWGMPLLYGEAEFSRILLLLLPTVPGVFVGTLTSQTLIATDRPSLVLAIASLGLFCNAALDLLWIPSHGASGAAAATSLTELLICLVGCFVVLRQPIGGNRGGSAAGAS